MRSFMPKWVLAKKLLVVTLLLGIITLSVINFSEYKWDVKENQPKKQVVINDNKSLTIVNEDSETMNYEKIKRLAENQTDLDQKNTPKEAPNVNKSGEYKDIFKTDLFIGDSITKALTTYNFLSSQNVCAKIGIGNDKLRGYLENAEMTNPEKVFLMCGVNDLDGTLDKESFRKSYDQLVRAVKTKFPNSNIYVQSVLPLSPSGEQKAPYVKNSHINECNKIIMEIAQKQGVTYLNISQVITSNNVYEADGLHFKSAFYPLWLKYVVDNVK